MPDYQPHTHTHITRMQAGTDTVIHTEAWSSGVRLACCK